VPNAKKGKQAARRERVAVMRAQQKRAERRRNLITIGAIAAVAAVIIGVVVRYAVGRGGGNSASTEVIPPGVGGGSVTVQAPTHQVPNTSGIPGVIEYITTGWPQTSNNGPAAQASRYPASARCTTWSTARSGSPTSCRCRSPRSASCGRSWRSRPRCPQLRVPLPGTWT